MRAGRGYAVGFLRARGALAVAPAVGPAIANVHVPPVDSVVGYSNIRTSFPSWTAYCSSRRVLSPM